MYLKICIIYSKRGGVENIKNNPKYYFDNDGAFKHSVDNVHMFVMTNYEIGMHKQEFFEINIVVRGKGFHHIDESVIPAEVGDVFIIPPEVEHGYTGGSGFDVYHIIVDNRFMQKNIADLQQIDGFSILFNVEPIMRAKVNRHLHLNLNEYQFKVISDILMPRRNQKRFVCPEDAVENVGTFLIVVSKLCRIYVENSASMKWDTEVSDEAFMRSLAMIHERYADKLTLDELAREAKLSKSTYMRRFVHVCKMPPAEYVTKKRIEVAQNLLKNSNASIMEIAEKVGFYDAAHFSRTFKKAKGVSPMEYRKEAQND